MGLTDPMETILTSSLFPCTSLNLTLQKKYLVSTNSEMIWLFLITLFNHRMEALVHANESPEHEDSTMFEGVF